MRNLQHRLASAQARPQARRAPAVPRLASVGVSVLGWALVFSWLVFG